MIASKIAGTPGRPGGNPAHDGHTEVTQTYGWTAVTHPAEVSRPPVVCADELDGSLTRLAAGVA
ncbi:hypothetical protein OG963_00915 [Streptomyces sp. NBC_01707]|uniref:hypothetical protein n=1 Tax=unclassified Streptomyces TaxID=2593676 RepID=UPI002E1485D3|nr:hypothetical protein OG763_00650 [Streptomyces sp. NBC_01230]